MPRVPRPDDMARASLQPASNPAQINIGVASRIGESGRAMGNAIASIGHAFGEVAGRLGTAQDAQNDANAKLEWLKGDHGIQQDIMQKAGEDGALWQEAPKRYEAMNADIAAKYPISDPQRRRSFEMWREQQTFNRGTEAARTYQGAQRGLFLKSFDQDLAGVEERLSKGDIDPATFGEYYGALQSKLAGMNRTVLHEADVQAKTRELQARLTMSLNRYVEPGERARFWDTVGKGRYEVEAPGGAMPPTTGTGPDFRGTSGPASLRYNNPGAMYPGASSRKFGSTQTEIIGGGHKIAVFPDAVSGAAAQFDLLHSKYTGETLRSAIGRWSGGNSVSTYLSVIERQTGLAPDTVLTKAMVEDPRIALPIAKAMATQEAGKPYPMSDAQWAQAHAMAFGSARTQVASAAQAAPAIKSDAVVPPPGIQLGPPTAGNDNPPALLDLGPEGDKIAKVAADQPDTPLSQVLSGEEIAALAEKHEAFRALGDRDDDITVGEVGKLVETVQEAPVRVAQAGGRDADTAVLGIPRGRLAPGQEFTVRTPKGEFKVPSEWINAIPDKLRQEYARRAREDLRLYERQLRTTADEMMKSQEAHVAAHGRDAPDYDVRAVQAAYARDPARIAAHGRRIRMAKTVFDTLGEAANLPDDEVVSRLERLKPKAGSKAFAEVADIYDKAEEKVAELLKQREKDPAGAVEGSKLVTRARESMVGGRPQSHLDQIVLIDARLKAQAALEIDETSRRPLPEQEAKALGARIRGLDPVAITGAIGPGATPSSALDSINATHAYIKKQYGERYSGAILAQAIEAAVRDKEKSKAFGVALQAMEDSGMVSPTTLARIRARDALNSQEKALPVKPPDKSSGIWEQMNQISRRIGATMPAISPDNPFPTSQEIFEMTGPPVSPPKRAIEWLRDNPDLAVEFERKYRLKPGEAVRYLAR